MHTWIYRGAIEAHLALAQSMDVIAKEGLSLRVLHGHIPDIVLDVLLWMCMKE